MTTSDESFETLRRAVLRLQRGDWFSLLFQPGVTVPGGPELLVLVFRIVHLVGRSMYLQVGGRLVEAEQMLTAAGELVSGGPGRPHLLRMPGSAPLVVLAQHTWQILERERLDLIELRRLATDAEKGHGEILLACVEHLTWVEFDPFLLRETGTVFSEPWSGEQVFERPSVLNRRDACVRATNLRQFAGPRRGDVSSKTWERMGGDWAVRYQALQLLAAEPMSRSTQHHERMPTRLGRLRAWQYARLLQADVLPRDMA